MSWKNERVEDRHWLPPITADTSQYRHCIQGMPPLTLGRPPPSRYSRRAVTIILPHSLLLPLMETMICPHSAHTVLPDTARWSSGQLCCRGHAWNTFKWIQSNQSAVVRIFLSSRSFVTCYGYASIYISFYFTIFSFSYCAKHGTILNKLQTMHCCHLLMCPDILMNGRAVTEPRHMESKCATHGPCRPLRPVIIKL